ncbi:methionine synthase [Methanocaldococcus fervens]|uniref:Methionine synthase vitamin-B12 independent n=1 Tax=Methanocaldococcus fervens (strain DSM 4213 / JCM 15782 / AG86) TaxID=573064 RepID=C7P8Z6_METFA|nr:methionine synthase [Methanocaldococcus fervens]ACV25028.1 Methionine synthase vitamin-B12 independent [Methanocaldococcus fervens AG86]
MITTVVGSYPVVKKEETFLDKIKKTLGVYDEHKYAIERAVKDQIKAGVDIISDGQVRGDMVEIFTNNMYGFEGKRVIGRVEFIKPITVKDILYAKNMAKKLNPNVEVKGIITGPCTIASSVRVEGYYSDNKDEKLIYDIAKALRREVEALKNHVPIIQIDEPILSTGLYDFDVARKAIDIIVKGLDVTFAMHVCGNVYNIIDELNKFNVDILDHEFASNRKNLDILECIEKKVGFGCVNTKVKSVESVDEIKSLIEEGFEILKNNEKLNKNLSENILIDPDCGMRLLPIDVAFNKLKNMVEATKLIKI